MATGILVVRERILFVLCKHIISTFTRAEALRIQYPHHNIIITVGVGGAIRYNFSLEIFIGRNSKMLKLGYLLAIYFLSFSYFN